MAQTNKQTNKHRTRELGSSGPYAVLFCLDDLDKKKHGDVINSLKNSFFLRHNLGLEPALSRALHASPDTRRIHTNSSKLLRVMILHLKALFEYALWPAVFDGTVRYGIGTGQVRSRVIRHRLPP